MRGQGGEGKTALAAEFARWMVRSHQVRRAAFVSVETHGHRLAVLDAVGSQLVGDNYSAAAFDDVEQAILPIERALREQSTLLVVDNMESILLPPYLETPEALSEEAGRELKAILALCERLLKVGDTRLVFTSREALPAPFDAPRHRRELHRLDREDAVKLVERALNADALQNPLAVEGEGRVEGRDRCRARIHRGARGGRPWPRPHARAAGPGIAEPGRGGHPRSARRTDGRDGAAVPRQPGALPLRQRRAFPPPHVGGEPRPGARARRVSRRGQSGRARA